VPLRRLHRDRSSAAELAPVRGRRLFSNVGATARPALLLAGRPFTLCLLGATIPALQ